MDETKIRECMELSIEVMRQSIQEKRGDGKISPKVGAVLVKPDGTVVTAYRGELRDGDHAEYTLLERKCVGDDLTGSVVFTTLEPCFERNSPKIGCSKRLAKARVAKVYVGHSDPDPKADQKGISYLKDHGVEVDVYPRDLEKVIENENSEFFQGAFARQVEASESVEKDYRTELEKATAGSTMDKLSEPLVRKFISNLRKSASFDTDSDNEILEQYGLAENNGKKVAPTGFGLLLFGENPQTKYLNAVIKATYKVNGQERAMQTITGPIIEQTKKLYEWYQDKMDSFIDRSVPERKRVFAYPQNVIVEIIKNAIVHRDYSISGAPVYFEINDDAIIVKSPGLPVYPLRKEQISSFNAPSLSRNPTIMFVFDKMGLAEQRGLGFETVRGLPKQGIPLPKVTFEDPYVVLTLPLSYEKAKDVIYAGLSDNEIRGYEYLKLNGPVGKMDMSKNLGLSVKTAQRIMFSLASKGLVETVGGGRYIKYKVVEN